jgi:hypothetical protein
LSGRVAAGARVAVVGAGHAHDLPLTRLLARAGHVDLIDIDRGASRRALWREPRALRTRGRALRCDVTGGAADALAHALRHGRAARSAQVPRAPLGHYDVVVADLLYTQLVFPALLDARLAGPAVKQALAGDGQRLCDAVVARLHASAPDGVVIHVHDVLGWWPGHQPEPGIDALLADPSGVSAGPVGCDVGAALRARGLPALERRHWRWPFADGVDYLVQATVAPGRP